MQITAWDRDEVLVEATKHSTDASRLNDAQIMVDTSSGLVSIRTQYTGADAEHPASVEYHIMVPRGANLENVKLVNGGLSLSGMTGPVKASSVNGSIKAERMEGQVELSTVNGFLEAGFQRISKCNPISLSSVNGPIKISLPPGAGANVSAHNLSGGIDADFGRAWRAPGRPPVGGRGQRRRNPDSRAQREWRNFHSLHLEPPLLASGILTHYTGRVSPIGPVLPGTLSVNLTGHALFGAGLR